jgi:hypothetical protein
MTDVFSRELEQIWGEASADAWEVLEPVRQVWRDEDRVVDFDPEDRGDES